MDLSKEAKDLLDTINPQPSPLLAARRAKETELNREADRLSALVEQRKKAVTVKDILEVVVPAIDERVKREDETMQEYSDRMDRLNRAKQKCQNCPHERGHHLLGDCGIGDCKCEKFVKREYVRPEHLSDRPFKGHEGLEALKAELDKAAPVSKKQNHGPKRQAQVKANSEARKEQTITAFKLKAKGMSNVAIGSAMKISESSVRSLLKSNKEAN